MKIGGYGFYGKDSLGDELLMKRFVDIILAHTSNEDKLYLFSDTKVLTESPNVISIPRNVGSLLKHSFILDVLVVGPGGLFPQKKTSKIILWGLVAMIMRIRKKKFALIGLGINANNYLSRLDCVLWEQLFKLCTKVVLRQQIPAWVPNLHSLSQNIDFACDIILAKDSLPDENSNKQVAMHTRPYVILALVNQFNSNQEELRSDFVEKMCKIIRYILNSGLAVKLIPFSKSQDTYLNQEIETTISDTHCKSLEYCTDTPTITSLFSNAEYVLAMRFHAVVLSCRYAVPVYAISYDDKIDDLMNRMNLPSQLLRKYKNTTKVGDTASFTINAERIIEGIQYIESNRESIIASMHCSLPELEQLAAKSEHALIDLLK